LYRTYLWNPDENIWTDDEWITFTNNENGLAETFTYLRWDPYIETWFKIYKDSTNYNSDDNIVSIYSWEDSADEWLLSTKEEFFYNADGTLNYSVYLDWVSSDEVWRNLSKKEYYYNNSGLLTSTFYSLFGNDDWFYNTKEEYNYDGQDNMIMKIIFLRQDDEWFYSQQMTNDYDETGDIVLTVRYAWDTSLNDWMKQQKNEYIYEYNDEGIKVYYTNAIYLWLEGSDGWTGWYKYETRWDDEGYQTLRIQYIWENNSDEWIYDFKTFYYRSLVTGIHESTSAGLTFYPNPVKNVLHILNESQDAKNYRILSLTGEILMSFSISETSGTVNLTNFPNGIYFLQYRQNGKTKTEKIIKL
jgi:hypothetical protein